LLKYRQDAFIVVFLEDFLNIESFEWPNLRFAFQSDFGILLGHFGYAGIPANVDAHESLWFPNPRNQFIHNRLTQVRIAQVHMDQLPIDPNKLAQMVRQARILNGHGWDAGEAVFSGVVGFYGFS
jgi:hypothetical protein